MNEQNITTDTKTPSAPNRNISFLKLNIKYKVEIAIIKTPKYPVGACFVKKAKNISIGIKNQKIFLFNFIARHKE